MYFLCQALSLKISSSHLEQPSKFSKDEVTALVGQLDEATAVFINCLKLKGNSSLDSQILWVEVMRVKVKEKEETMAMPAQTFHT